MPKVTVLIAVYNGERFLKLAIASVLGQTFRDFELLIVDDASTDGTSTVIRTFDDVRIRVIHNDRNRGAGNSRNRGIENARGEYIAVLDSDDVMYPHRLARQVAFLDLYPQIALVGGAYDVIDQDGRWLETMIHPVEPMVLRWNLLFHNIIATSVSTFRKTAAVVVGGYDETLTIAQDYAFNGKLALHFPLAQLSETVGAYRWNSSETLSSDPSLLEMQTLEVVRRNIFGLISRDVDLEILRYLRGNPENNRVDRQDICLAYALIEECLATFLRNISQNRRERRLVFMTALSNIRILMDQCLELRLKGFWISLNAGICYVPECLCTLNFFRFVLGTLLPASSRDRIKQFGQSFCSKIIA